MKNSHLSAPLRVFWDINHINPDKKAILQKEDIFNIADRIISCKPFYVNLGEDILNYEYLPRLLDKFKPANIKLSLSSSGLIKEEEKYDYIKDHKLDFLEFKLDPHMNEIAGDKSYLDNIFATLEIYKGITKKVCPSLVITGENYEMLPYLFDRLIEHDINYFKMPNTVINEKSVTNAAYKHLLYDDVEKLREIISERVDYYKSKIDYFIHDLFIFEIFYKTKEERAKRPEYGGCQAGNALCYIDQKGDLYLCSSLYVSLGSVLKEDIKSLFSSEKRLEYKKMIDEQYDEQCIECTDFLKCKGGCRGIVYFMNDSFLGLDPLCPFKKDE